MVTNPNDQEREALERIVNGAVGRILDKYARESHPGRPAVSIEHIDADVYADAKLDLQAARAALAAREEPRPFTRDDLQSDEAFRAAEEILTGTFGDPSPQEAHTDLYGQIIDAVCDDLGAGDAAREGEAERLRALAHHLHEALAFMRSCELSGESGADHSTVISALEAYEGFEFDSERNAA